MDALTLSVALTIHSTDLQMPPDGQTGRSPSLWCELGNDGDYTVRRVSLLAPAPGDGDLAITAGHDLSESMICELRVGSERQSAQILRLGHLNSASQDWALVSTSVRLPESVTRYRIGIPADTSFPARLDLNSSIHLPCYVFPAPSSYGFPSEVALHTCQSVPGRSGAPFISSYNGEEFLVGINLGWVYDERDSQQRFGYLRRIDGNLAQLVNDLSEQRLGP